MGKMTDAERDALKSAAETATTVLPKLREERENLDRRIGTMEAVIAAYEASQGRRYKPATPVNPDDPTPPKRKRAKKGQVSTEIESVLSDREMELREIRDAIRQRFGTEYARNTLLTVLQREETKFKRIGERKWRINPLVVMPKAV